jgi:hypothetical protein
MVMMGRMNEISFVDETYFWEETAINAMKVFPHE